MSKMDNLRAMREARYEQAQKRGAAAKPAAKTKPPVAPDKSTTPAEPAAAPAKASAGATTPAVEPATVEPAAEATPAAEELCGHRNMSGRTCTRERGHAAKSHRYS